MMGHEVETPGQGIVAGGTRQYSRDIEYAPIEFLFAAPAAKPVLLVERVRIALDQGKPAARCKGIRDGVQVAQCGASGLQAGSDRIPGQLVGIRDAGRLGMLSPGKSFFFDRQDDFAVA